jgi:hypothetical protein
MKNLINFLVIIFIASYSRAQDFKIEPFKNNFFHDSDYSFAKKSYGKKSLSIQHYQLNLNKFQLEEDLLDSLIYTDDGSTYREFFSYNENASMLERKNQKWDDLSGMWINNIKRTYIYGEQSNQIIYTFFIGEDNKWKNDFRSISTFTDSGNLLSETKQRWDATTELWFNRFKIIRTYDESENVLIEENQYWDRTTNKWVNDDRIVYTYDNNSNILTEAKEDWADTWIINILTTNTYDVHQNLVTQKTQNQNSDSTLKNYQLLTYTYDETDLLTEILNQFWDSSTRDWKNATQSRNTYDDNGYKIRTINSLWSTNSSSWQNRLNFTYTNNVAGKILTEKGDFWDTTSESWATKYQITLTYDDANNLLTQTNEVRDNGTGLLIYTSRISYSYYSDGKKDTYLSEVWNNISKKFEQETRRQWTYDSNGNLTRFTADRSYSTAWRPKSVFLSFTNNSYDYLYSCEELNAFYTAAPNESNKDILFRLGKSYPNPFNGSAFIPVRIYSPGNYTLQIYNLLGQKVNSLYSGFLDIGEYNIEWDGKSSENNSVSSGLYIYQLSGDKGLVKSGKSIYIK